MPNQLVQLLEERRGSQSIRQFSKELCLSHAHVTDVLKGKKPVTWQFAATVAQKTGMDYLETFRLAGLLPESETK